MKRGKRIMTWLFSLVIGFSMLVPNNVFAITNEDDHIETSQTNLANDQLAKQNASGIHDIFYPKDNSKLELFKACVFNRLLYKDEEIDVSDIDISPYEIQYTYGNSYLNSEYAARQIVRDNVLHSTVSTIGFPIFTYKDNGNVATVKYTYHPAWTDDFIKRVIASYDEAISLINPDDTDFAKALKLHDWIVKNVSYGMSKTYSDFAVGALANRSSVCAGYAQCYQFLLSQVGVQSTYIAANTTKEPHAWNLVKIDGHYFHVDCTWDRGLGINPNINHTYFMLNDEEFNADGAHTEDWKDPSKGYPTNNQCSIENKFYKDYKVMVTDEQIVANPIKIKHVYDGSTTYNTSSSEHWRTCVAGVEVYEKHDGNPCSVCHYETVKICDHAWINNHNDSYHWEECSKCKEIRNKEKHTSNDTWENDGTYHWKRCSICGYEINRVSIEISVTDILLNTTSKPIQKGKTYTLVPTIVPTNATNKKVTYTTSNSKVATVTTNGTIRAINGGTAVITAKTSNEKKVTCKVTVPYTVKYNLNGGTNNKSNPTSYYGKKITLQNPTKKGYVFAGWYSDSNYKTKVTSFSSGNKVLYAKWNKVTVSKAKTPTLTNIATRKLKVSYGTISGVKGYQIQYATNSKFTGSKTKITSSRSYTLTSLTKGKRYYVRVKGYKVDSTGNKVYGSWGTVKSIKIYK